MANAKNKTDSDTITHSAAKYNRNRSYVQKTCNMNSIQTKIKTVTVKEIIV